MSYTLLRDGEPKGSNHGEPRVDGLNLVIVDGEPEYWINEGGERVCSAKRHQREESEWERCRKTIIDSDNHRCKHHGGNAVSGIAHSNYKDGSFSRYLPDALGDRMDEFMKDPNIASVRKHIALLDTRLAQKLEQLEDTPTGETWEDLQDTVQDIKRAWKAQDPDAIAAGLNRLERQVAEGAEAAEEWSEIFDVVEQRRKLAETETKRTKASQNTLTVEEASMLVDVMVSVMQDVVERYDVDRAALQDINEATRKLLDT